MATVLITGGTGTVGKRLTQLLIKKGYTVQVLSRSGKGYTWDPKKNEINPEAIQTADFIIHLAGAGVADQRWSDTRKKEIEESRTQGSSLIASALAKYPNKVQAVISASAIGWYGPDNDHNIPNGFKETDPAYSDFLGDTCKKWEQSIEAVNSLGIRLVILRTGIVLSNEGGAFVEFKKPLKLNTAAILATGQQVISWIHVDDLCNQYIYAIENTTMQGVYNAVAPNPANNQTLTLAIARKLCPSFFIPFHVPAFVLKIVLGEMSIEILKSTTVNANKMLAAGFPFQYPTIDTAINELLQ
ncbi:MAG: hypothetical protein FD136_36 [Chitinophagaceae bacterium]|nr:MAG: hypothetical protein FD183_1563 [Chitinophagaceae bacterium]TXT34928.1 MAG: hypothetical protein FD136_36 [Chitinophagaceae bacterium]